MSAAAKQFIALAGVLIGAFLALEHYTGFSRDVGALSSGGVNLIKVLQGRG